MLNVIHNMLRTYCLIHELYSHITMAASIIQLAPSAVCPNILLIRTICVEKMTAVNT